MRVSILTSVLVMAATLIACSDAPSSSLANMRRASSANDTDPAPASSAPKSAPPSKPSSNAPTQSDPTPAPSTRDAGTSSTPAPAPEPGSCAAPKCIGAAGLCGCKATDSNGALVVMGCQDGQCACTGGTDAQFEGDCTGPDDAKDLFFANCGCQ